MFDEPLSLQISQKSAALIFRIVETNRRQPVVMQAICLSKISDSCNTNKINSG